MKERKIGKKKKRKWSLWKTPLVLLNVTLGTPLTTEHLPPLCLPDLSASVYYSSQHQLEM